jgi:CheY-like chemotaxis protein
MNMEKLAEVLVVEDDPAVREIIATILREDDFNVIEAGNGLEAVELLKGGTTDVIVSDLSMPIMNGLELAKHNYDNWELPFVACTAVPDARFALKLLKYGVQDFVSKPIDRPLLATVVKSAFNRKLLREFVIDASFIPQGNVSSISFSANRNQIIAGLEWIREKTAPHFTNKEHTRFLNHTYEYLLNAFEHGSLGINEKKKTDLLTEGRFDQEIKILEATCAAMIKVDGAILKNEVLIRITDEGDGFDYNKYLHMTEETILERLEMPNGRGIIISAKYFDSIEYEKGGSSVLLIKKFQKPSEP